MATILPDGRGQTTLKGREITNEWEALVRKAASRVGATVAGFVVDHTTAAAQSILKDEPVGPPALPVRIEDVAASLHDQLTRISAEQNERIELLRRQVRRGRWRR
jgi:uncharacterized protein (DUF1778 family)